ncbi:hypothetical protein [Kocuria sp.]|uniref:hypothetical protein n=1 Tax=Kocuria sp. TaxID=1871328 RepID=UPI0026DCFFFC|nr:hypothetical protein [Kocuria sp.]MDO4919838.1 hypothetical protein [Kocuria sp.]
MENRHQREQETEGQQNNRFCDAQTTRQDSAQQDGYAQRQHWFKTTHKNSSH